MSIHRVILSVIYILSSFRLVAQSNQVVPGKRVVTYNKQITLESLLGKVIVNQVNLQPVFNYDQFNAYELIECKFNNTPLDDILSSLLIKRGLTWVYFDQSLIVKWANGSSKTQIFLLDQRLQNVINHEKSIGSTIGCDVEDIEIKNIPYSKVLSVERRPITNRLPVLARYFYAAKSSIVRVVVWDWVKIYDSNTSVAREKQLQEVRRWCVNEHRQLRYYQDEYRFAKESLIEQLGQPTKSTENSTVWDSKQYRGELILIFTPTNHRIRFIFHWK